MSKLSRRTFIQRAALGTAAFYISRNGFSASPNDKLNIGFVGTAHQARFSIDNLKDQNIVAICDVDENFLAKAAEDFPGAKKYNDFRRMLEQKDIDAVVVATPDHTHAVATVAALRSGHHVYCEKPLTHTVSECRIVREAARKAKKATQMGTQIHAGNNYRRVVELIQKDAIGEVKEVHVWAAAIYGGKELPTEHPPVPSTLHYDLWTGPIEPVAYSPEYVPFKWRNWWAFGGGTMADFGCHFMDLPHWALDLREPIAVSAEGPERDPNCPPVWMIAQFEYPARKEKPPVKLTWYQGGRKPDLLNEERKKAWPSGVLFVGEKGNLLSDYSRHLLLPEDKFQDYTRPDPFIPNSIGHHKEWVQACKTGSPTTCNFDYSGALSEAVLLGNVAFRAGKRLEWDSKKLKATNTRAADEFVHHHYRKGWKI